MTGRSEVSVREALAAWRAAQHEERLAQEALARAEAAQRAAWCRCQFAGYAGDQIDAMCETP